MNEMRKETVKYHFSVEGETERRYLSWLEEKINGEPETVNHVRFACKVERDSRKYAKGLVLIGGKTEVFHVFDYEGNTETEERQFLATLDCMKKAESLRSGKLQYRLAYSNLSFELWMILHKKECFTLLENKESYLADINCLYGQHFSSLNEYKEEKNFKRILEKLELSDVKNAVRRAEILMREKELRTHGKYKYCEMNPATNVGAMVRRIFVDCGLWPAKCME